MSTPEKPSDKPKADKPEADAEPKQKPADELGEDALEQVSGGATGGAGAGKIKFNEFTIKK